MVVPACIAAVADIVMRQLATDKPSRVCVRLRGTHDHKGFTIGTAALAKQSAEVASKERKAARARFVGTLASHICCCWKNALLRPTFFQSNCHIFDVHFHNI